MDHERKYLGQEQGCVDLHTMGGTPAVSVTPLFNEQQAKVAALIVAHLGVEAAKVVPTASFADDLGADSLDMVELVMEAEAHFGIGISDDEAENLKTVQDAFDVIATAKAHEADAVIRPVDGGQERFGRPLDEYRES